MGTVRTAGWSIRSLRAGKDLGIPAAVGLVVWVLIGATSKHQEAWNDPRYWPMMSIAAFGLGFLVNRHPKRMGLLFGASPTAAGVIESLVHVRDASLLLTAPLLFLLYGAVCVLTTRGGALARKRLDRLTGSFATSTPVQP